MKSHLAFVLTMSCYISCCVYVGYVMLCYVKYVMLCLFWVCHVVFMLTMSLLELVEYVINRLV